MLSVSAVSAPTEPVARAAKTFRATIPMTSAQTAHVPVRLWPNCEEGGVVMAGLSPIREGLPMAPGAAQTPLCHEIVPDWGLGGILTSLCTGRAWTQDTAGSGAARP